MKVHIAMVIAEDKQIVLQVFESSVDATEYVRYLESIPEVELLVGRNADIYIHAFEVMPESGKKGK